MGRPFLAFFAFLLCGICTAQAPLKSFDVSSIKPSGGEAGKIGVFPLPGGGLQMTGATLKDMIAFAYDVKDSEISGGPKWMGSARFDVIAKNDSLEEVEEQGFSAFENLRLKLQPLLAERFGLKVHTESKTVPVYVLKVVDGSKLKHTSAESKGPGRTMRSRSRIEAARAPIKALCQVLSNWLERPVLDQTGLEGLFDYTLRYAPNSVGNPLPPFAGDEVADDDGPSLFVALQEQLGLKLESGRGPIDVIVVDRAELPGEN